MNNMFMDDDGVHDMSLDYDFDIVTEEDGQHRAFFRSARTVEALQGADKVVREYFEASGFGFDTHNSGAGPGFYPAKDEKYRVAVIEKLGSNLTAFGISGANMNGFDLEAFLTHLTEAEPIEMRHSAFSSYGAPGGGERDDGWLCRPSETHECTDRRAAFASI